MAKIMLNKKSRLALENGNIIKTIVAFFILFSFAHNALAASFTYKVIDDALYINHQNKNVRLTAYDEEAIEVLYQAEKNQLPSFAIAAQTAKQPFTLVENDDSLEFTTGKLTAVIDKAPFNISFFKDKKLLLQEASGFYQNTASGTDNNVGFRFNLSPSEKLLGGGQRVLGMDRRGHKMPLYNKAHYGYSDSADQMYYGLPAVMSSNKYILLFDNSASGEMDLGKTDKNIMQLSAVGGRSAYVVFAGDTYPKLIKNYVEVTGKQPMPPRWALGNFASRFGYRSEKEVRMTAQKFIDEDFPLDALIIDLYWFGKDIQGHMGNLAWDKETFPTPTKMIDDLKEQGVNTIVITEPFVLSTSKKWQSAVDANALATDKSGKAKQFDFYFGNTGLIDVFNDKGQQWFNQVYQSLYNQGIAGWWGDLGEPEVHPSDTLHTFNDGRVATADEVHNVYGHQWAEMVFDQQLSMAPTKRPFIMMRSGFAGTQRFGIIPWTGDVSRTWGGLGAQVELSLQMSVLGLAYTHSDLGGFAGGEAFDAELYTRWLQYGVFQPVYRPHGDDNIAAEPIFHDKTTKDILREYVKLRYELLPYNYTLAYQNSTKGLPLMRPLFFEDESNLALIDNKTSYLWGDAFLVTPVIEPEIKQVSIPLPKGVWFDYWSNKKYQGNQTIQYPVDLKTLPVLVRAGAFIPMIAPISSTQDYTSENLVLHYYDDASVMASSGEMYEDAGNVYQAIEKGLFEHLQFSAKRVEPDEASLVLTFSRNDANTKSSAQGYQGMPDDRNVSLVIHQWQSTPTVVVVEQGGDVQILDREEIIWNKQSKTLTLPIAWQKDFVKVIIK